MQSVHACAVQTHFFVFLLFLKKVWKRSPKCSLLGTFWGPLGSQTFPNLTFELFRRQPKKSRFFERLPCSLLLQNGIKMGISPRSQNGTFWVPFSIRHPPSAKSALKVTCFINKVHNSPFFWNDILAAQSKTNISKTHKKTCGNRSRSKGRGLGR